MMIFIPDKHKINIYNMILIKKLFKVFFLRYYQMMNVAKDKIHNIYSPKRFDNKVSFDKNELGKILNIYGKMVALGEWRDYGISILKGFFHFLNLSAFF